MSDVQSAAERLRRVQQGETLKAVYSNPHWAAATNYQLAHECDMAEVALAYLADNPADSELPITEEWLRSVGFTYCAHWGALNIGDWHNSMAIEWDHGKWRLSAMRQGGGSDFSYSIPAPQTRGDVRRLCQSLGIPLTP